MSKRGLLGSRPTETFLTHERKVKNENFEAKLGVSNFSRVWQEMGLVHTPIINISRMDVAVG